MASEVSVERTIAASPETLYAMVSDITRMREWSPENTGARWVGESHEPVIGARFRGSNQLGWRKWSTTAHVVAATPPAHFAFEVRVGPIRVSRWEYRFEAAGDGCRVVETWTDQRSKWVLPFSGLASGVHDRPTHNAETMRITLEQLDQAARSAT